MAKHTFPRVFEVLSRREGKKVTLPTLVTTTGLTENQVKGAIAHARRTNPVMEEQIEVVEASRAWKFVNRVTPRTLEAVQAEIVMEAEMGSPHTWKHVFKVLRDNPGEVLTREDIVERVEFPTPTGVSTDEERILSAMNTILHRSDLSPFIEVIQSNRSWRYKPATVTEKKPYVEPSPSLRSSVLRYFTQRPGQLVFADDIASDLGFTRKQVQGSVWSLAYSDKSTVRDDFEVVQGGHSWRYVPNRVQAQLALSNGSAPKPLERVPAQALSVAELAPVVKAHVPDIPLVQAYTPKWVAPEPVATPAPAPAVVASTLGGRLFEEIGQAGDGSILIREAESKLVYRATEL